jgi:hypothetical protein
MAKIDRGMETPVSACRNWHGQGEPGQHPLGAGRERSPLPLAEHLEEPLVPPGPLAQQAEQAPRSLLTRHEVGVVGDADTGAERGQPYAQFAVLGQAVGVPSVDGAQHVGADEHGVATERDEPVVRVQMEAGAEPEEVLEAVA